MSRKSLSTVNQTFREWTHGVSFILVLGKTQVGALISVHASKGLPHFVGSRHRLHSRFVSGVRGLQDRGLVIHHPEMIPSNDIGKIFEVTPAGEGVVALLRIAGVYQEVLAEFQAAGREDIFSESRKKIGVGA